MIYYYLCEELETSVIGSDKGWADLCKVADDAKEQGEEITFDFTDIQIVIPQTYPHFKELVCKEWVHLELYTEGEVVKYADMMCRLSGKSLGRVKNTDYICPTRVTPANKQRKALKNTMSGMFVKQDDGSYNAVIGETISQICNCDSAEVIVELVNEKVAENGGTLVRLDFTDIIVSEDIIKYFSSEFVKIIEKGYKIQIEADESNVDLKDSIDIFMSVGLENKSLAQRLEIIKRELKPGVVGVLTQYKRTRGIDSLGRMGKGEIRSSIIAIYRGMDADNNLLFDGYVKKYFTTQYDFVVNNDNEELLEMPIKHVKVNASEIGIYAEMVGSGYHFSAPVQEGNEVYTVRYFDTDFVSEDGDVEGTEKIHKLNLPDFIKYVLDERGIDYNKEELNEAIEYTKMHRGIKGGQVK